MTLAPGTRIGPYEIVAPLGAGGMGEVYRATDNNLKRSVAIKVLPGSVAGDADRLARFQREAEVLAALNHPNIAAIHGLEKTADLTALVAHARHQSGVDSRRHSATPARARTRLPRPRSEAAAARHRRCTPRDRQNHRRRARRRGWCGRGNNRQRLGTAASVSEMSSASNRRLPVSRAIAAHLHVRGLQVAVDDALLVRRFERVGDLPHQRQCVGERDGPARDHGREVFALDERRRISPAGGRQPVWARDGKELFYLTPTGTLMRVSVDRNTAGAIEFKAPTDLFQSPLSIANSFADEYAVSNDGRRFLFIRPRAWTNASPPITVVVNWAAEFAK